MTQHPLSLRTKVILFGVMPLVTSLALIALAVAHQQRVLAAREHSLVEHEYMQARRTELRHYVELAASTIRPLYDTGRNDVSHRNEALRQLAALDYGADGYFFVYDLDGTVLMHSRQPELIGRNLWNLRDPLGRPTIQQLIARAKAGGGYVDYLWRKPSTSLTAPKLGYVIALERWNWMLGTGLYLDDIHATMAQLDQQASGNITATLLWIAGIAAFGAALTGTTGLFLNLSEHRAADAKLRLLAQQVVQSQEAERAHLARELHDGISQTLVSTKLLVESEVEALQRDGNRPLAGLQSALARLNTSLNEVRRISHRLRPALLDTLGLPAALQHLGREFEEAGGATVNVTVDGTTRDLPDLIKTVLFRVTQECLTNIAKHARARQVDVAMHFGRDGGVRLKVSDDGQGFDAEAVGLHPKLGIGLRNMRERLASVDGSLAVVSSPGYGTEIEAQVPASALQKFGGT